MTMDIRIDISRCKSSAVGADHGITPGELQAIESRVFDAHRFDFCCGGNQSLRSAAAAAGVDAAPIAKELQAQVPALAHTTLRLQNAPGGGVIFFVNEQLYQNLEDIPDPAVQALIRAATRQWEKR